MKAFPDNQARPEAMLADLLQRLPGYTPELMAGSQTAAQALLQALARYRHILDQGLERAPDRGVLAGLDMLEQHLLPSAAARVPLVFSLAPDAPSNVTLPSGSQVAAPAPAFLPSLEGKPLAVSEPVVFATERAVTISRSQLKCLYSLDPTTDRFADHLGQVQSGFTLFDQLQPTEHAIYLGHDQLFALGGEITLLLGLSLDRGAASPLRLRWEYFTESGWIPLENRKEDDTTGGFIHSGQFKLHRECGPDAKKTTFGGRSSFWIRGITQTPVVAGMHALPIIINDLNVRAQFGKRRLPPEAAFLSFQKLDVSKSFLPFGSQPVIRDSFYLASDEVFQRGGARCRIEFCLGELTGSQVALQWEYSTGSGWKPFPGKHDSFNLIGSSAVSDDVPNAIMAFNCPADWDQAEVNGVKKRWLRATIISGSYGLPGQLIPDKASPVKARWQDSTLHPPIIDKVRLSFEYLTDPEALDHCLSFNDFVFADHTEDCIWPDRKFSPFVPVSDTAPALYFGFNQPLQTGLLSLYMHKQEDISASQPVSPYLWEYRTAHSWADLSVIDETQGFRQRGMLQFIGPDDAVPVDGLGGRLYRLRARLKAGEALATSAVEGVWWNATWAMHRRNIVRELLGVSDGNPGQALQFVRTPVLSGETIEAREWSGRGEAWRAVLAGVPDDNLRFEQDPATRQVTAVWVRWHAQPHLHDSDARQRHYVLERATGLLRFGRCTPRAGQPVVATYATGGGMGGNVKAQTVRELRAAAPHIVGVDNPVSAQGGSDAETLPGILLRGPQQLRHRGRSLSAQDYEWLARDASPEVARCRCEPLLGPDGHARRGWVTLRVLPMAPGTHPQPSQELTRCVHDYVAVHALATVRLRVVPPDYVDLSVAARLVAADPSQTALVEARVRVALDTFLHPLTGGAEGAGWAFGQAVHLSRIAQVIEAVPGLDYAIEITLKVGEVVCGEQVDIPADKLVAAGRHELSFVIGGC